MSSLTNIHTNKDLKAKLRLETILRPEVKKIFRKILDDFKIRYAITGRQPDDGKYDLDWMMILQKHYKRAQKRFTKKGLFPDTVESIDKEQQDKNKELLLLALGAWREQNSLSASELIGKTTADMMRIAIDEARTLLSEQEQTLLNRNISATATKLLERKFIGRIDNILISETQKAVESTKQIIVQHIEKLLLPQEPLNILKPAKSLITKMWLTVGDDRVRPTHKIANRQKRKLDEPYNVGGELLMTPGDSSLGATPKETNRCRCSSIITNMGKVIDFHG